MATPALAGVSNMKESALQDSISKRIVVAAAQHFIDEGFESSSTSAIAKTARTSKREIYSRFGNKDALFEHVMRHLCGLVNVTDVKKPDTLSEGMQQVAHLVLARSMQDESIGVLISALGASGRFPELPRVFWREGPGQAVKAISKLFESSLATESGFKCRQTKKVARDYVLQCMGPFVLGKIYDL